MTSETNQKSTATSAFEGLGREIGEAARKLEQESEKVISYLNAEVVPAIRTNSSKVLRVAAEKLAHLAEYMDQQHKPKK
jgi:predicted lipid-binding transport protein (Tim44 family)